MSNDDDSQAKENGGSEGAITIQLTITGESGAPRVPLQLVKSSPPVTPSQLRSLVSETTRIPREQLKLIFRGRLIGDDESKNAIEEFKLEEGSVLHCMGKPAPKSSSTATVNNANTAATTTASGPSVSGSSVSLLPNATASSSNVTAPSSASAAAGGLTLDPLPLALQNLLSMNSASDYQTAVTTLQKILENIEKNPREEKYRKVKKSNAAFTRRLGGLRGGREAMLAAGFVETTDETDSSAPVYKMLASAEAWPKLLRDKATLAAAAAAQQLQQTGGTANQQHTSTQQPPNPFSSMPGAMPNMGGGMPGDLSNMMMSDPNVISNMMQSPMFQQALQNDPRFANNPMMQQAMREMSSNPQLAARVAEMMRNPERLRQMMQQMQQMEQMMGAGAGGAAGLLGQMPPFMGAAPPQQPQSSQQQPQASSSGGTNASGGNGQDDEQMTEEEMIAEAIRRSLQE